MLRFTMSNYDDLNPSNDLKSLKPTILSEGTEFIGIIQGHSHLVLSGRLIGTVKVPSILVDSTGCAEAEVVTQDAQIKGSMKGQLDTDTLSVGAQAAVDGSVTYGVIQTQKGATLLGTFVKKSYSV